MQANRELFMEWLALDIEFVRKHGFKKMCSEKAGSQGGENVSKVRTKKSAEQVDPKHVPCVKLSALRFALRFFWCACHRRRDFDCGFMF